MLRSTQNKQLARITFKPLIRKRPIKQLKQISILIHFILTLFLFFVGDSLIGQYNFDFVTDFSGGKGSTYRTSAWIYEQDCTKKIRS
jgi:hypothetical protein